MEKNLKKKYLCLRKNHIPSEKSHTFKFKTMNHDT